MIAVDGRQITGMEPPALHGVQAVIRPLPVAVHDDVAAGHDFANRLAVAGHVAAVGIDDADLDARNGIAGAGALVMAGLVVTRHAFLDWRDGEHRRRFGEPVSGNTRAPELLLDVANQRRRRCRPADHDAAQAADVVLLTVGTIHERNGHRRHQRTGRDLLPLDEAEDCRPGRIDGP